MKKKSLLLLIPVILTFVIAIVPVICFLASGWYPTDKSIEFGVTYWVIYGLSILACLVWCLVACLKHKDAGITYLQCFSVLALQFLPLITLIFANVDNEISFIIPIIIAAIAYAAFLVLLIASNVLNSQVKEVMPKIQAKEEPIVDEEKAFNNEDGSFKGSRVGKK